MGLRDDFDSDLDQMFDTEEFATVHQVDGSVMTVIVDEELVKERQAKKSSDPDGYYVGELLFMVKKSVFGERPAIGQLINFEGITQYVSDCQEDEGMYIITLGANLS